MTKPVFFAERVILAISNGAAACIQGLTLGLLSNPQLERLTQQRYADSFESYAREAYVRGGLFLWESEAIRRYFPPTGQVLVAAAGAGREMIALAKAGYRVDGFDCCAPLVESGQKQLLGLGIDSKLQYAAPSSVPEMTGSYDAVLVGFSGYMYIPGRENRINFLKSLRTLLNAEAPLMVSFVEGFYGRRRAWTAKIGTAFRRLRGGVPVEEGD